MIILKLIELKPDTSRPFTAYFSKINIDMDMKFWHYLDSSLQSKFGMIMAWHGRVVKGMGSRLCGASSIPALLGRVSQKRKLTD